MRNAHTNSAHGQSGSTLTRGLADAQINHAVSRELARVDSALDAVSAHEALATVYRIYTEDKPVIRLLSANGFDGASLHHVTGVWQGQTESGLIVEIVARYADRKRVLKFASDILGVNEQSAVLVVWHNSRGLESITVNAPTSAKV